MSPCNGLAACSLDRAWGRDDDLEHPHDYGPATPHKYLVLMPKFCKYKIMTEQDFEDHLRRLVVDLCEILWEAGVTKVPMDAIMRCIGVPEEAANSHQGEFFALDGPDFQESLARRRGERVTKRPPHATLH